MILQRLRQDRCREDDDGFAMVLVLGTALVIAIVVTLVAATAIRSLKSSTTHVSFEQALAAAETGIDEELSLVQTNYASVPSVDYVTPAPCNVSSLPNPFPSTEAGERAWARQTLEQIAADHTADCVQHGGRGDYVAIRPPGRQAVYAMGWAPSYDATNSKVRLLKAEYLFGPYKPGNAVLTNKGLNFSGSVAINTVNPDFPANIHSNTDVASGGSGSLTVQGSVTASGTNSLESSCPAGVDGGCQSGTPLERVPTVDPRYVYSRYAQDPTVVWYDLCPDGTVRPGSSAPCTAVSTISTSPFNGWVFTAGTASQPPTWTLQSQSGPTTYPGAYYVYGADAVVGNTGNDATLWNITVLSEAAATPPAGYVAPARCGKYGGDITWKLFDIRNYLKGLIFMAQGSVYGQSNTTAGDGVIMAGDKVSMQTSSATVNGSIVAQNACDAAGPNVVQGVTVNYNDSVEAPITDIINTTLWLEYVGS